MNFNCYKYLLSSYRYSQVKRYCFAPDRKNKIKKKSELFLKKIFFSLFLLRSISY